MKPIVHMLLSGLLIWLTPFLLGSAFYDANGNLATDVFLFKTIMILVLSLAASVATVKNFKKIDSNFMRQGLTMGFVWMFLSLLLDIIILIPISGMSGIDYTYQIGLRYLIIPTISTSCGFVAHSLYQGKR